VNTTQAPQPEAKKLAYTIAELSSALGVSAHTLYRLEKRGLIKAIPGIRHKIYPAASIDKFLKGEVAA
jgi:DNA-binding transcriptional MerR regulator